MKRLISACLVFLLLTVSVSAFCGDGYCDGRAVNSGLPYEAGVPENWDNCNEDCGVYNNSNIRNIGEIYVSRNETYRQLIALAEANPSLVSYEKIGSSIDGNDILLFKAGNGSGKFMFDGQGHGPEDCGTATGQKFLEWALTQPDIMQQNTLLFIPVINNNNRIKRQNTRRNYTLENGSVLYVPYGVDLNRNFPAGFGGSGASDPNSTYEYRGLYGGSEPETQAVMAAIVKYKPQHYMNVHCGMQMLAIYGNNTLANAIKNNITLIQNEINSSTNSIYGTRVGAQATGGYVARQGCTTPGSTCSLFEISEWGNLPKTLAGYHARWYPEAFPVYLGIVRALQKEVLTDSVQNITMLGDVIVNVSKRFKGIAAPALTITKRVNPDTGDYRHGFLVGWDGTACENLEYAKAMGYDYVAYMDGMEKCPGPINMKFYIEAPNYLTPQWELDKSKTYTLAQISMYEDWFALKNNGSFPGNIATGWFYTKDRFRPIPDFQRQDVIDYLVVRALNQIEKRERPDKGFYFGGWSWDVPSLEGDFWSDLQRLSFYPARANGTGQQVTISYWTGDCSGVSKGEFTTYSCFREGYIAYYKALFAETEKYRPGFKVYMEPYHMWSSYLKEIANRSDVAELLPDIICSESAKIDFLTDQRILSLIPADRMCSDTPDSATHVKNLELAGKLAVKGAWFNWFGRLGGTGDFAPVDSMTQIPARLKLIRAIPGWDNLNGVSLSDRSYVNGTYSSAESYADLNLLYSRNPKNSKLYVVVLSEVNVGVPVNSSYVAWELDTLMRQTGVSINGTYLAGRLYLPVGAYLLDKSNSSVVIVNNTPKINESAQNKNNTPKINRTELKEDLISFKKYLLQTNADLKNRTKMRDVRDLIIKGKAKIDFTGQKIDLNLINESAILITDSSISIDSNKLPELDRPATLTFYGVKPRYEILHNGIECRFPTCAFENYNGVTKVLSFRVSGFSNYTVTYNYTYVKSDLKLIVEDGIGTFGASIVEFAELIVIALILLFMAMIVAKYKK